MHPQSLCDLLFESKPTHQRIERLELPNSNRPLAQNRLLADKRMPIIKVSFNTRREYHYTIVTQPLVSVRILANLIYNVTRYLANVITSKTRANKRNPVLELDCPRPDPRLSLVRMGSHAIIPRRTWWWGERSRVSVRRRTPRIPISWGRITFLRPLPVPLVLERGRGNCPEDTWK